MGIDIEKDEADAAARRVPIFLQKADGTPQDDLTGVVILYRRPDAVGGDLDVTGTLAADGGSGRHHIVLTTGHVDTAGLGWVSWSASAGHDVVANTDFVRIKLDPIKALLPAALDGSGFIKAQVKGIDSTPRDAIAAAAWDVVASGHATVGSFGDLVQVLGVLLHLNSVADNTTFDASHMLTAGRLRGFADAATAASAADADANNAHAETRRFVIAAESDGDGEWTSFRITRSL